MARGLKFRIKKVEGLYYLCSENKGADQLRGYREADLRLCFCICKKLVFSRRGSNKSGVFCELNSAFNGNLHYTLFVIFSFKPMRSFGARVSVMFHFMFVHYTFSSVWVAEWPPFGK